VRASSSGPSATVSVPASATDIAALLKDAITAYRDGRGDEAERLSRRLLAQQPDHVAGVGVLFNLLNLAVIGALVMRHRPMRLAPALG
jgi:hypothetical protein